MQLNEILSKLDKVKKHGDGYLACCPAHDDKNPSLSVYIKDDKVKLYCHAGCSQEAIKRSLGISNDYQAKEPKQTKAEELLTKKFIECYDYTDEDNKLLFRVNRYHYLNKEKKVVKKSFPQQHFENGNIVNNLDGVRLVPYRLPRILDATKNEKPIYLVEGEKDVHSLEKLELVATTLPMGAGKWKSEYLQYFVDADVIIIPDNDKAGNKHKELLCEKLFGTAKQIRIVELPNTADKEDVTDWLNHGGDIIKLLQLVKEAVVYTQIEPAEQQKNEIREIRENIYRTTVTDDGEIKYKLIIKKCALELLKRYDICCTKIQKLLIYYIYKDGYWQYQEGEQIDALFCNWLWESDTVPNKIEQIRKLIGKLGKFVPETAFNGFSDIVNLQNSAYDQINHHAIPHSKEHYFTYKLDFDYDETATCNLFDKALVQYSLGDNEWIRLFWEIAGYIQTGNYEHQKMFWFIGRSGGNGKGTVLRVMHKLVGNLFTLPQMRSKDLGAQFYRINFKNKRFAYTADMDKYIGNISIIKQLTGGDMQMSDVKFNNAEQFTNNAKIVMAMNDMPMFPDDENLEPLGRRVILLKFDFKMRGEQIDPEIEKKFMGEMSGIFNKSMLALKRLQQQHNFSKYQQGERYLFEYLRRGTMFQIFCEDYLTFDPILTNGQATEESLFIDDIFEKYRDFYQKSTIQSTDSNYGKISNSRSLGMALKREYPEIVVEKVYKPTRKGGQSMYKGLRWKDERDMPGYSESVVEYNDDIPF